MSKALTNAAMLQWAMQRAGLPLELVAKRLNVSADRLTSWLEGVDRPTSKQAQNLASILYVPFGYLFLDQPPVEELAIPDLRTVGNDPTRRLDINFRDLLNDVLFKQDWFREYLEESADRTLPFVGSFPASADPKEVAADMRKVLFGGASMPTARNWEEHLRNLMISAEDAGVWVMRNGVVGNNTHRPLSVQQFRGFAISDPIAPLVFINGKDAKAAQIFTLAHELAHIWLGSTGISNVLIGEADYGVHSAIERKCNKIAAEFLVPEVGFGTQWHSDDTLNSNADRLSRHYRVSRIVIVRRAFDLGLITADEYSAFYAQESARWQTENVDTSGGDFNRTLPMRNGVRFTQSVVRQAMSGRLLLRQAAALLNTQPASLVKFHQKLQAA